MSESGSAEKVALLREKAEQARARWRKAWEELGDEEDDDDTADTGLMLVEQAAYKAWVAADFALRVATGEPVHHFHLRVLGD